jgi:hypothetical protein
MTPVTAPDVPTPPVPPTAADTSADAPLRELDDEGDRPSITETNGTVARFEMAYAPDSGNERYPFGPTLLARLPAILWFLFSVGVAGMVVVAHHSSSNSALYMWVVERDPGRLLPSSVLAFLVLASGIATLVRTHMRGVIVQSGGIEARYLLAGGLPRVRQWAWAQVHRFIVDESDGGVVLELWTGQYEKLPPVARALELAGVLERKAAQHGIPLTKLKSLKG